MTRYHEVCCDGAYLRWYTDGCGEEVVVEAADFLRVPREWLPRSGVHIQYGTEGQGLGVVRYEVPNTQEDRRAFGRTRRWLFGDLVTVRRTMA